MSAIPQSAIEQIGVVGQKFDTARIRADERARVSHERFNVFTTLLKEDDEVRLHTRFIHCLLDPTGLHDCGALFLKLFFQTLAEVRCLDHSDNPVPIECDHVGDDWSVEKEASRGGVGQIDLLLERPGVCIAIENKIYAAEQRDQLARYGHYVRRRTNLNARVIYLTLDGKRSTTHGDQHYLRISYSAHILTWLEKCLCATYSIVPVNQTLLQYRQLVRSLTGQTIDHTTMKEITDYIEQHTDLMRYREQIKGALDSVREGFLNRMAAGIVQGLQPDYTCALRFTKRSFGVDPAGTIVISAPESSLLHTAPFKICVQHWPEGETLLIGLETNPPLEGNMKQSLTMLDSVLQREGPIHGYSKREATLTWPTGWYDLIQPFNDELMADLMKQAPAIAIDRLCTEIRDYIGLYERTYAEVLLQHAAANPSPKP